MINDKGRLRGNNEDNFFLNGLYISRSRIDDGSFATDLCQDKLQLYAVCDGMGGIDAGEEASCFAIEELARMKPDYEKLTNTNYLTELLRSISDSIYRQASKKHMRSGTTIAMVLINGDECCFVNVGDSRAYRFRDGRLQQISTDHSKVQRKIDLGMITREQARTDPERHMINQFLGMPSEIRPSPFIAGNEKLLQGDRFLLCSDGLTDMVEDEVIESILRKEQDPEAAARALLQEALNNGGKDNTTIMLLHAMQTANTTVEQPVKETKKGKGNMIKLMTAAQVLAGVGLILTAADLIYYLLHV